MAGSVGKPDRRSGEALDILDGDLLAESQRRTQRSGRAGLAGETDGGALAGGSTERSTAGRAARARQPRDDRQRQQRDEREHQAPPHRPPPGPARRPSGPWWVATRRPGRGPRCPAHRRARARPRDRVGARAKRPRARIVERGKTHPLLTHRDTPAATRASRSRPSAREVRDLTVPRGNPSVSAVSASERSSRNRAPTISRSSSRKVFSAAMSSAFASAAITTASGPGTASPRGSVPLPAVRGPAAARPNVVGCAPRS